VGTIVVGLGTLEEKSARARGELDDLFKSPTKGGQAFDALTAGAKEFGTSVASLTPGLVAFQTALANVDKTAQGFVALKAEDLPGGGTGNVKDLTEAYNNFLKILRAGRLTQDEAQKSAAAFFDTLKNGGPITKAALQSLPVGTIRLLQEAMGAAGLSSRAFFELIDSGALTVDKFKAGLANFGPEAQKAFDTKAIKTMGDEIGKLFKSLGDGFGQLTGKPFSDFVVGELSRIGQGIKDTITEGEKLIALLKSIDAATELPGLGKAVTAIRGAPGAGVTTGPTLEQAGLAGTAFLPTPEQAGKAGAEAAAAFNEGFLKKGFVFPPKLAQDAGSDIAANLGKGFVDNKFFQTDIPKAMTDATQEGVKEAAKIDLSNVFPTEDQAALVEQFKETGANAGKGFNEGVTQEQLNVDAWLGNIGSEISSLAQSWFASVQAAFANPVKVNFDTGGFGGQAEGAPFAGGGLARGPGSSTSDSILAWLSDHEFVVRAQAVKHYGTGLFAALNAMALPKDFMSHFAMGGLARAGGNRFAAGGQVSAGNPFTLVIDRHSFNMTAGSDTITALKRYAVASQISSTGRKPRFVR
jgi:hypothetical protein